MEKKQPNLSGLMMQAQESKHLANRLMNLRGGVDQSPPKQYPHLAGNNKYNKKV